MCDYIRQAVELAEQQRLSRRGLLAGTAAAAGSALLAANPAAARSATAMGAVTDAPSAFTTRLVLLGTAGGPVWWHGSDREGIASAVVVNDAAYLVDCGEGVGRRYRQAGLGGTAPRAGLRNLRGIFLTHLHSDHIVDYFNLWLFGWGNGIAAVKQPVQVFGPGDRGKLPPIFGPPMPAPAVVNPGSPTPGTVEMTQHLVRAYATDLNDRLRDNREADLQSLFEVHDIEVPEGAVSDPNADPAPPMAPFKVFEDDNVRVTATLVSHAPVYPAFGFRFDTDDGSVVFSGDTAPSDNLIRLARGADILVHEVIDRLWVQSLFPDPSAPAAQALIQHLLNAHTTTEDVGAVAEEAGVRTLVLTHLVPANLPDGRWRSGVKGFSGRLVIGHDLQELGVGSRRGTP